MSNSVDMTMRSDKLRVTKIVKKTKAEMFEDIEVGDIIQLSVKAKPAGTSRGRTYATDVKIENLTKGVHVFKTFNTLDPLKCFEFEKVVE